MVDVSVIIPSYNRAGFVGQAIESVLAQTGVQTEIIVVDDGSSDNTKDVVAAFGPTVHYIYQSNAGASAARNTGIGAASADLVAFLDSDDLWLPDKLARQCADLEATDAVAHLTNVMIERPFAQNVSLMALRGMLPQFDGEEGCLLERPLAKNVRYNFARTQSILVRRENLLKAGLYDTAYTFFEDTDLMNRLALQGAWYVSPVVYVREIRREEAIEGLGEENRRQPQIGQQALVRQMRSLLRDGRVTDEETAVLRDFLGRYAYSAGKSCLRVQQTEQARDLFSEGWQIGRSLRCLTARGLMTLPAPVRRAVRF